MICRRSFVKSMWLNVVPLTVSTRMIITVVQRASCVDTCNEGLRAGADYKMDEVSENSETRGRENDRGRPKIGIILSW